MSETEQRPPRPLNCFLAFRLEKQNEILARCPGANHRDISKITAKWWRELSEEAKEPYREKARLAKIEHAKKYPNYKYQPKKNKVRKARVYPRRPQDKFTSRLEHQNRFLKMIYDNPQMLSTSPSSAAAGLVAPVNLAEYGLSPAESQCSAPSPLSMPDCCPFTVCTQKEQDQLLQQPIYSCPPATCDSYLFDEKSMIVPSQQQQQQLLVNSNNLFQQQNIAIYHQQPLINAAAAAFDPLVNYPYFQLL